MRATVLVGAASWSERSLVHESGWYPRRNSTAAERMAYYAARFPLVEIDATRRFPPTPELARQWVARTPPGFTMDLQAWTLLTGEATLPDSLWEDLRHEVRPELRDRHRLYLGHLSADGRAEAWARFRHALAPLHQAGRLGAVILRSPHWLPPGDTARALLAEAAARLPHLRLAVEPGHPGWLEGDRCEDTLSFLEDQGLGFVCVDRPPAVPVVATTTDLAVVRLAGPGDRTRYSGAELAAWVPRIEELAAAASQVHVLLANCHRDDAVVNAAELRALLG